MKKVKVYLIEYKSFGTRRDVYDKGMNHTFLFDCCPSMVDKTLTKYLIENKDTLPSGHYDIEICEVKACYSENKVKGMFERIYNSIAVESYNYNDEEKGI